MKSDFEIGPYEPCPCGSGKKYKFCCASRAKAHGKFPIGTIAYYGPDDKITTKIVASVIPSQFADPVQKKWFGPDVRTNSRTQQEIKQFFGVNGVKTVGGFEENIGCPHEEGIDYPRGRDCPECPFWRGKSESRFPGLNQFNVVGAPEANQLSAVSPNPVDSDDDELNEEELLEEVHQDTEASVYEDEKEDFEVLWARVEAIVGNDEVDRGTAIARICQYLQKSLKLPFEVTGIEDFRWEEPYVLGGWSPAEYKKLKKTQPSYRDIFDLISINSEEYSQWMMHAGEDIAARVRRTSDGKLFVLGLSELKAVNRKSENWKSLNDYTVWFVNSR
jgi:hypothetical protein